MPKEVSTSVAISHDHTYIPGPGPREGMVVGGAVVVGAMVGALRVIGATEEVAMVGVVGGVAEVG